MLYAAAVAVTSFAAIVTLHVDKITVVQQAVAALMW